MGNQKTSQGFSKKVILSFDNLATFPLEGKNDNLYFDIEKGKMYYWNGTAYKVWSDNIEILLDVQPTPTAENNTTNKNKIFKDADGTTWYVDYNGKAISMGSTPIAPALWNDTTTDPPLINNTGVLPRIENNINNTAKWYIDKNGRAERIDYRKVAGSILAANVCVNNVVHVPNGNPLDIKTVGTGGNFTDLATALASATVVSGTILKVLNDLTVTATVNVNKAVVIDLNGKVISSSTTLPVNVFDITAGAVLKNGSAKHLKTTNTSVETVVNINSPTAPVYVHNIQFDYQEFAISTRGRYYIFNNDFNYVGASSTNSHRVIILYGNSGESRIFNNKYTASAKQGTTRYTNFILATSTTGTAYSGKLFINNNIQMGGDLRQFFMHEAGVPTEMELYIAHNTFNDFNGGIGFLSPTIYNGYSKIGIYSNTQGGDAVGNYKGVFYVDGTGAINENTILEYADNVQGTTALRADYLSYAKDNSTEIAIKNTITFVNKKTKVTIEEADTNLGLIIQQLKGRKTFINGATGSGTEADPYVVTTSIKKHDYVGNTSYCGYAVAGSLEDEAVWHISKIVVATDGSTTTTTANNVKWSERLTINYN